MTIEVEHRTDELLQNSVKRGVPDGLEETYVGRITAPTHVALLGFLEEKVVGKKFKDAQELRDVLSKWPEYALESHGLALHKDWERIGINEVEEYINCGASPGGDFVIGRLVNL